MTEDNNKEFESRVKTSTSHEISNEDLQAGGFVFRLPDGTDDEERQAFEKTISDARESGKNLTLSHEVTVIDTKAKPKGDPNKVEVGETKPEPEEPEETPEDEGTGEADDTTQNTGAAQPASQGQQQQAQPQPQPQQQHFVQPQNNVQYTNNQAWQYDPFTGAPMRQQPQGQAQPQPQPQQPPAQQPQGQYNPQLQGGQPVYNPQPAYQQPQQQQNQQQQQNNNNQ